MKITNFTELDSLMIGKRSGRCIFEANKEQFIFTFNKITTGWSMKIATRLNKTIVICTSPYKKDGIQIIHKKMIEMGFKQKTNESTTIIEKKGLDLKTEDNPVDIFIKKLEKKGIKGLYKPYKIVAYSCNGMYTSYGKKDDGTKIQKINFRGADEYYEIIFNDDLYQGITLGSYNSIDGIDINEHLSFSEDEVKNSNYIKKMLIDYLI